LSSSFLAISDPSSYFEQQALGLGNDPFNREGASATAVQISQDALVELGILSSVPITPIAGTKIFSSILSAPKFCRVSKGGSKLLETPREVLLRNASDPRLKDAINNLYRKGAKAGSGSTADAVRFEKATGELLSPKGHTRKLIDRRTQLIKLRKDPNLSSGDKRIIHGILKDAQDALSN